jgi:Cu+-exporting ATPase
LFFLLAFLTFLGWFFFQENLEKAVITAATVLLISCPCALGLATPIAVMVSCGKAAQEGLIIRSALALERAGQLDVLIFDKTGTLTQARPVVVEVLSPDSRTLPQEVNLWVNSLEQGSEHPLSRALVQWANTSETLPVSEFQAFPGRGIQGKIAGKKYRMGTRSWLEGESVPFDELFPKLSPELSEVFLCEENTPLVLFGLKDLLRPEVPEVLEELRTQGIRFILASGDRAEVVEQWGVQLGIRESFGGLQPEEKRQKVLEEVAQGKTVGFVGDGINDASALAVASVGFAMGTGTDIAMQSADITLTQGNLKSVLKAILLARATRRLMVQNLAWAFVYNLCAIPLAITGLLSPMLASGAMAFSSFSVVCNSLRLKYWKTSLRIFQKNPPFVVIPLPVEKENPVLTLHLKIQGMTCQNCVRHVQQALEKVQGVSRVQVSLEQGGFAKVESFAPLKASELIQVLKEGGYEASL